MTNNVDSDEIRILSPTAILGYGFPESSFRAGLARKPHLIAVDAGSTDPGPYYLGAGVSFTDRQAVHRDLRHMLVAGRRLGIPVVIGTGGGAGCPPARHLDPGDHPADRPRGRAAVPAGRDPRRRPETHPARRVGRR